MRVCQIQAQVFFGPYPIDHVVRGLCGKHKNPWDIPNELANFLVNRTTWYPKRRHVVIANDWASGPIVEAITRRLPNLIVAVMENTFPPVKCLFGLGYTTYYAVHAPGRFGRPDQELKYHLRPAETGLFDLMHDISGYSTLYVVRSEEYHVHDRVHWPRVGQQAL
jgi:hypothetical protein